MERNVSGGSIRAIVFDMDGVLVESASHWRAVASEFLSGLVPGWGPDDQRRIIGMSALDVHTRLVEDYGVAVSREQFLNYYRDLAVEIYGRRAELLPGVIDLVTEAAGRGLEAAIASSSPRLWIETVVKRFELDRFISVMVSGEDFPGRGKPAPDIFRAAAAGVGYPPEACVAIEDSARGVISAKSAGMLCVGIGSIGPELRDADLVIGALTGSSLARLERFLGWRDEL